MALIILLIAAGAVFGASEQEVARLKTKITKVKAEITRLQKKLGREKTAAKKNQLKALIKDQNQTLSILNAKLAKQTAPVVRPPVPAAPEPVTRELTEEALETSSPEAGVASRKRINFEVGGTVGLFAGAISGLGELRFPHRFIVGPANVSFRLAGGFSQSRDGGRRYVPVCLDGILNFPPGWFSGVNNYIGAGLNYVALTTGRVPGSWGGQIFYGVESEGFGGQLFGELGYAVLRTGFSSAHLGTTVLAGYRTDFGF